VIHLRSFALVCAVSGMVLFLVAGDLLAQPTPPPGATPPTGNCGNPAQPCATMPNTPTAKPPSGTTAPATNKPPAASPGMPPMAPTPGAAPPPGTYWCPTLQQYLPRSRICPLPGANRASATG
jgi:hypothetical protein